MRRRSCCGRRLQVVARLGAALLLLCALLLLRPAFENKALGSSWFAGVRKSPLQLLHDLDQVLSSMDNGASCVAWKSNFPVHHPSHHTQDMCLFCDPQPHDYIITAILTEEDPRMEGRPSLMAKVHQQRRELLQQACSRHTRRQRLLQPEDLRHVLVDDAHGLLYCYVPKVACTNWKRVLLALRGRGDPGSIPAHEAHAPGLLPSLADFAPAEVNRRLRDYLAFLFVREPFERLASAYRNKLARPHSAAFQRRYGTRIVRRLRPHAQPDALARGHDVRFAEFLAYLLDPRTRRHEPFNEHWERAHALCHPCLVRYDVVGKFETLADDAAFVLDLVGEPGLRFPAPPRRSEKDPTRDQARRLFQDISPFYQRRLFDLYKMDFLLFNYSAPSYLRLQ